MSRARHAVIAAGGTGGHMFPAQALAEVLLDRGWRVTLSTDDRGARYAGGFPAAVTRQQVASATFARGGIAAKALAPVRIVGGIAAATLRFLTDRPDVVAGFGGYPSIPALSAAWALRIPRLIHEQNGVLGRVNQVFAPRVDRVACGTWPTALPRGVEGAYIGNPVRAAILAKAGAPYPSPASGDIHLLVMGGSQGARVLSDVVPDAISRLPRHLHERIVVSHQARPEDADRVTAAYAGTGIRAEVQPFFNDVPDRLARSALAISRAGASSIADFTIVGRPAILIPFAAATGDHQTANARGMAEAGGALLMPETALDPGALSEQIHAILTTRGRGSEMAAAALGLGRPDAAERLADLVETLAEKRR